MNPRNLYFDLLERALMNTIYRDQPKDLWLADAPNTSLYSEEHRVAGLDFPSQAHTMIGRARLRHLRNCLLEIIAAGVAGDFIECGVWRGGACIYLRALMEVYCTEDDTRRKLFVADTFDGPPPPIEEIDRQAPPLHLARELAIPLEDVRENFRRYGFDPDDERIVFLKGHFRETLLKAPIERLALLRLDADTHEATTLGLGYLYAKLSPGGFCIIDDYNACAPCKVAVQEFRAANEIKAPLVPIPDDGVGVFWRKEKVD